MTFIHIKVDEARREENCFTRGNFEWISGRNIHYFQEKARISGNYLHITK